ncbi:hypothetical protein JI721_02995 [Alicyclobacillus cycloheptanicus]|uniref:Response regulatory domain-containing protein n=1 Tax=Alicyclobacillus cycloheptanicus TaxID=1457 RepID=A0ABT9XJZ3_9BACL|nr:hypothetical protein [Alicyclobacillus cycloheptanicus]MDQ0190628.1 hypothetical protein [Alicyclobacillus cycloheptanicus]WDM01828.1 hypothetical protein JI721_02995 [Alicyclobacillus cycloheptanicus]
MIYAISSQATADSVRGVLGDADIVQTVKDCRDSLSEAQRLPVDTMLLDVATIHSADDVLAYQTTVRQCPRIVLLAPDAVPGNKTIGQLVSYGVYDIVTDLDRLRQVIDGPAATIVQAARWIIRNNHKQDLGKNVKIVKQLPNVSRIGRRVVSAIAQGCRRLGAVAMSSVMISRHKQQDRKAKKAVGKTSASLKQGINDEPTLSAFSEEDTTTNNTTESMCTVDVAVPDPVSFADHIWDEPKPVKSETQSEPAQLNPKMPYTHRQSVLYRHVLGAITVESWALARAVILLAWRAAVLGVQLLPYALGAEVAVLLGYLPHWTGMPAQGYWSIAQAVDPRVPSMQSAWHYVIHFASFVGRGGGKA